MSIHEFQMEEDLSDLLLLLHEEEQSSSSHQTSSDHNSPKNGQKSNKYYRKPPFKTPFIPSIRILRRDVRRKYPAMLANVMNSHDTQLFSSFAHKFYRPECTMSQSFPTHAPACFTSVQIQGIETLSRMQELHNLMSPDSIVNLSNSQVCKRLYESGSRIIGSFHISGTVIYLPKVSNGNIVDRNEGVLDFDMDLNDFLPFEQPEDYFKDYQLAANPLAIQFLGTYELVLDENHHIDRLIMSWQDFNISRSSL